VQALSAGVDSFDTNRLRERGIALTSASGVHADPMAQQVFGYVFHSVGTSIGLSASSSDARGWTLTDTR